VYQFLFLKVANMGLGWLSFLLKFVRMRFIAFRFFIGGLNFPVIFIFTNLLVNPLEAKFL